ncbi:cytochrome P450 [Infundibulicybe gibba]|nr:cytochrome P450 [Infundibulicybe gibba]
MFAIYVLDGISLLLGFALFRALSERMRIRRGTTALGGPENKSVIFGMSRFLYTAPDSGLLYEQWMEEYGPAYQLTTVLGAQQVVLCDPKAISHFFSRDTFGYERLSGFRKMIQLLVGKGVLWAEGDSHKRQRKSLAPAFSHGTIRTLIPVFFDSAYKLKDQWDSLLGANSSDGVTIEVQQCLDAIGLATFGHDFHSLDGKKSPTLTALDSFGDANISKIAMFFHVLQFFLPIMGGIPTDRNKLFNTLSITLREILGDRLQQAKTEKAHSGNGGSSEKSAMDVLIESESQTSKAPIDENELMAQMKGLLIAGYDPPASNEHHGMASFYASLPSTQNRIQWALLELCKQQEIQSQLREELLQFSDRDPTWDQFVSGLPLLDAIVSEVLRLHPPIGELNRQATEDDIIPLGAPVQTLAGHTATRISIARGTVITIPIRCINKSVAFWGEDAKEFKPSRWHAAAPPGSRDIHGYKHMLTYGDGPRTCLGKGFSLAITKATLAVLIRNFTFELPGGPETKIGRYLSILPRPVVEGLPGFQVPLIVRRAIQ